MSELSSHARNASPSDAPENQNHPVLRLRIPPRSQNLIEEELPSGSPRRVCFDDICKRGSDPDVLFAFLTLMHLEPKSSVWQLLKVDSWSRSQWKKLPRELDDFATKIESLTRNESFANVLNLYWKTCVPSPTPIDTRRQKIRRLLNTYQRLIPQMLRDLGTTMRSAHFLITNTAGPKRYDTRRHTIIQLLAYVRKTTGEPLWTDVGGMLDEDPDALKKAWRRARAYCLLPKQG